MAKISELWGKMNDGDRVVREIWEGDFWAERQGNRLLVQPGKGDHVSMEYALKDDWKLVKEEEKEIETEKWMRIPDDAVMSLAVLYGLRGEVRPPSEVMDRKNFLRWGGTLTGYNWPGDSWCVWTDKDGNYWHSYFPQNGYTKQVFADYALMRVEK